MRRMYSEQELTNVIKAVFEQELEDGALDENVADAVDAYLLKHPVDITALEGKDVKVNSLDADGLITSGEIVEKMSGYNYRSVENTNATFTPIFCGCCKNGNKITFVIFASVTRTDLIDNGRINLGRFNIPSGIGSKLHPYTTTWLAPLNVYYSKAYDSGISLPSLVMKNSGTQIELFSYSANNLELNTPYVVRCEVTLLLSENLAPEE